MLDFNATKIHFLVPNLRELELEVLPLPEPPMVPLGVLGGLKMPMGVEGEAFSPTS